MGIAAGIAALLSVFCFATGALAHATLVSTEPSDGSVVEKAPNIAELRVNESVTPAAISLIDAEGKTRDDVSFRADGQSILVTLPAYLPRARAGIASAGVP